jgi:glycosyltransferase involved in cell wall biosynthesis
MPRIYLNAANLKMGGLKQVALNFILKNLEEPEEFDWYYAISTELAVELKAAGVDSLPQSTIYPGSPAKNKKIARAIYNDAHRVQPCLVFTFGGPAYIHFELPHLMGMYDGWVSHAGKEAYRCLDFPGEWLKMKMLVRYKSWWTRRANWWVMETEAARQGLHRRLGLPLSRISLVSNSAGSAYTESLGRRADFPSPDKPLRMLCFCAPYKHKNLDLLPRVAKALQELKPNFQFTFIVTLPQDGPDWRRLQAQAAKFKVLQHFDNRGPVLSVDGPDLYRTADCLFLPTVLETFSATYPEAMCMGLPILTPALDYLEDICRDAALYFPPYEPQLAASRILELAADQALWNRLIDAGKSRVRDFPSPNLKKQQYYAVIREALRELK